MRNAVGKTVDVTAWGPFSRDAETAGQHMSPDVVEQERPHLIQELGRSSAGTMFQSMERVVVGRPFGGTAMGVMDRLRLFDDAKVHRNEKEKVVHLDPGAIRGSADHMKDPSAWVVQTLSDSASREARAIPQEPRPSLEIPVRPVQSRQKAPTTANDR